MKEVYRQRIGFSCIDTSSYRLVLCVMWCETTSGMPSFMSFVEGTHLHQSLPLPKAFYNKGPLVLKQTSVQAELLAFYLKDYLAFLRVKSSLYFTSALTNSSVLIVGTFCNLLFIGSTPGS